ncbi:hypothetical protein F441_09716 [Phytophthora nicotianae CJ01A1]|uniref:Uncharacterized protein n=3 Tax=Phytophthora nicotianae TaxID=4792 RepID=W2Z8C2_PHYNI|nr:hypothetical protein F441_09716 [Phytophthora nicotianae CJ01A1]ETP43622.1 hypothetical protein F442_09677 [Phytophthora nicotianae P10297]
MPAELEVGHVRESIAEQSDLCLHHQILTKEMASINQYVLVANMEQGTDTRIELKITVENYAHSLCNALDNKMAED